mmetsp:Transcript_10024/g.19081  ORF Transcript_10024/g.19081 Transcript_10024/m.19081 type:complete len:145 (+) Transcript_10024:2469-2903(+)
MYPTSVGFMDSEADFATEKGAGNLGEHKNHIGMLFNYLMVGILSGAALSLLYPIYNIYLKAPSNVINTVHYFVVLGYSFKFLYRFVSDSMPIMGRPKVLLGWGFSASATITMVLFVACGEKEEACYTGNQDGGYLKHTMPNPNL